LFCFGCVVAEIIIGICFGTVTFIGSRDIVPLYTICKYHVALSKKQQLDMSLF